MAKEGENVKPSVSQEPEAFGKNDRQAVSPNSKSTTSVVDSQTLIALTATTFFCSEGDPEAIFGVMRVGNLAKEAKVRYSTSDPCGDAGHMFVKADDWLNFEAGESFKEVKIKLKSNDKWGTTVEFLVTLHEEGLEGATLNKYLSAGTIRIKDSDTFPTSKFKEQINDGDWSAIPGPLLMVEYWKLNWGDNVVRRGTRKMLCLGQLHNLNFIMRLFINVYLVDFILKGDKEDLIIIKHKKLSLWLVIAAQCIPFILLFLLDQRKHGWKVGGKARSILQSSLLRKFMNYTDESRSSIDKADLVMAMTRDVDKLVHESYVNVIVFFNEWGKLVLILGYQLASPFVFGKALRPQAVLVPNIAFPLLMFSFLLLRKKITTSRYNAMNMKQDAFVDVVHGCADQYQIIADYGARSGYCDYFGQIIKGLNGAITGSGWTEMNNLYFARWVTIAFVNMYIFWYGGTLIDVENELERTGGLEKNASFTLGMFLAEVKTLEAMGKSWENIYKVFLNVQTSLPALDRITRLENKETDLVQRTALSVDSRRKSRDWRDEALAKTNGKLLNIDNMPIKCQDMKVRAGVKQPLNLRGNLVIEPGTKCALVGPRCQGKATFLKLIGGAMLPSTEQGDPGVFVPSHARVLHVSLEPMFIMGSLRHNLTFGVKAHEDADEERILSIVRSLGVDEDSLQADLAVENLQHHSFSQTEAHAYHLARAFIQNPTVLCIHKPTLVFDEKMSEKIQQSLCDFVQNRGLSCPKEEFHARMLRTCIFTSTEMININSADQVIHISREGGIRDIPKDSVTPDMLY